MAQVNDKTEPVQVLRPVDDKAGLEVVLFDDVDQAASASSTISGYSLAPLQQYKNQVAVVLASCKKPALT
jgi:hypothetical protein